MRFQVSPSVRDPREVVSQRAVRMRDEDVDYVWATVISSGLLRSSIAARLDRPPDPTYVTSPRSGNPDRRLLGLRVQGWMHAGRVPGATTPLEHLK